jgi:hypothetical protein
MEPKFQLRYWILFLSFITASITGAQNVGIGINTPLAKLHVAAGSVLFSSPGDIPLSPGDIPESGPGRRMLWYADKAAFRVGFVNGPNWDKDSIGNYSFACGSGSLAKSFNSFAAGLSFAKSEYAVAMGYSTAEGLESVALGSSTAYKDFSFAGGSSVANGNYSTAFGLGYTEGSFSAAIGNSSAKAEAATALGNSQALGQYSVAGGFSTTSNSYTAAFGNSTTLGGYSFAGGKSNANGVYSTAFGASDADGNYSTASGDAHANGLGATAIGDGAVATGDYATALGSGTATGNYTTASGNGSALANWASAFGNTTAMGLYSVSAGTFTRATGTAAIAIGNGLVARGYSSASFGMFNDSIASSSPTSNPGSNPIFILGNGSSDVARSNAMIVLKNGNVGIGTNTPGEPLSFPAVIGKKITLYPGATGDVGFSVASNDLRLYTDNSNARVSLGYDNNGTFVSRTYVAASGATALFVAGSINANGTVYASDGRFKKNINEIDNALDKVLQMHGVTYEMKAEEFPDRNFDASKQIGLIAQDVEKVIPEVVVTNADGYKAIDYAKLVPVLIESIKEQQKTIKKLEEKLETISKK